MVGRSRAVLVFLMGLTLYLVLPKCQNCLLFPLIYI